MGEGIAACVDYLKPSSPPAQGMFGFAYSSLYLHLQVCLIVIIVFQHVECKHIQNYFIALLGQANQSTSNWNVLTNFSSVVAEATPSVKKVVLEGSIRQHTLLNLHGYTLIKEGTQILHCFQTKMLNLNRDCYKGILVWTKDF